MSDSDSTDGAKYRCLDLFSGLGGFSSAFQDHPNWEVVTVDADPDFNPDIVADVFELRPTDFDRHFHVILAGVPCTCFSVASMGYHWDDDEPATEEARDAIALVYHTVGLIQGLTPDYWFMENPKGRLRTMFEQPEGTVWYCQYGRDYAKPTDLWGDHPHGFEYRSCSYGNAECHHEKGTYSADHDKHGRYGLLKETDTTKRALVPPVVRIHTRQRPERPGTGRTPTGTV